MDEPLQHTISLVRDAQAGDSAAMEQLFARYLPRVRQIVALRLGMRPSALSAHEDIVQEALLNTFKNLERYEERSEATFRNWISQCVANSIRDYFRRANAEKRGGGRVKPFGSFEGEDMTAIVFPGDEASPSSLYGRKELVERIETHLLEMKEHWREVVVLRLFCEMSYREIGDAMGIREEATVRKLFSRAVGELKRRCS